MGNENASIWKEKLVTFDFEVTKYDWLLVIKEKLTGIYHVFHNDPQGVEEFINKHDFIYIGYNNKHYDNYILKGVLHHYTPEYIKKINDWIIVEKKNGWEYPFEDKYLLIPPSSDLMLDMPLRQSLKELEGNMCMDIQESTIDFNIDHPWTKEEFDEMVFYCKHDVDATEKLIDERMGYLEAKVFNGNRENLTVEQSLYRTNGQLAAIALNSKRQEFNDERDIQFPDTVKWENIPQEVIDFFCQTFDKNISSSVLFNKKLKINLLGLEWTFAWGGVHASLENEILESNEDTLLLLADVVSLYPSLMEEYNLTSRAVPDPNKFFKMKYERVNAKHNGDKVTSNNLKVPINTVYGISLQQFSDCYDPRNGRSVCVTGQLLLTDLCVELCNKCDSIRLNNVNTDGVGFSINKRELNKAYDIMKDWEKRTRLELEIEKVKRIILKDINNYILEKEDGSLKVKGGYVSDYKPSFKHNSLSIVATAIVDYFTKNKSVEETINECNDPFRFQLIAKTGSTYDKTVHYVDGEEIQVQKVNRLYAVDDERYGVVKKVKKVRLIPNEQGYFDVYTEKGKISATYKLEENQWYQLKTSLTHHEWKICSKEIQQDDIGFYYLKADTAQNCPEHALIDNSCQITIDTIDKLWYIKLAKKRINDFLGIKEKKETKRRKKKMPAAKKTVEPKVALYKKIFDLGIWLSKQPYIADGYNDAQSYEYVGSSYYREVLGEGCREVGLLFKFNIANRLFTVLEKTKNMNLTTLLGSVTFIDPDTGEHEDYTVMGDGADMLDKGMYKAETMIIKYFVLNNFLLPKTQDDVDPESGKEDKKAKELVKVNESSKVPPTKEQRKEVVKEVVNNDAPTEQYVNEIVSLIDAIRDSGYIPSNGKPYAEGVRNKCVNFLKGEYPLSKVEAVKIMNQIEERADKLEVGEK